MGWEVRMSSSRGVPYFFNADTKSSSWEPPAELSKDDIAKLPGAAQLLSQAGSARGSVEDKVRASHLLVKHKDSRNPSSWKEKTITRTKEEAISILRGYQAQINGDTDKFAELARQHSDDNSYKSGGDLGFFGRGQMQKPFEEATYALEVGQISDIVSTASGVHLIMRTA